MRKVFFQGKFDLLNVGHTRSFKLAKEQGDWLRVALNSDRLIKEYKGIQPIIPFNQRKEILEAIRWIDEVVEIDTFSPIEMLEDIDVYVIAPEWRETKEREISYMQAKGGSIFWLPVRKPGDVSSTEIRRRCRGAL